MNGGNTSGENITGVRIRTKTKSNVENTWAACLPAEQVARFLSDHIREVSALPSLNCWRPCSSSRTKFSASTLKG